jgi:hypothetical protein
MSDILFILLRISWATLPPPRLPKTAAEGVWNAGIRDSSSWWHWAAADVHADYVETGTRSSDHFRLRTLKCWSFRIFL